MIRAYADPIRQREGSRRSAVTRTARAEAKRAVVSGQRPVVRVLADQDEALAGMMLADLLMLAPRFGRGRLRALGWRAARDRVNLMTTLGAAPVGTRAWLVRELSQVLPYERKAAA